MMIRNLFALAVLCSACFCAQTAPVPATDAWNPLRFLLGTWEAKTQGGSAGATTSGLYSFQLELKSQVMARHSSYTGCKGPADFDCDHGDILYIYRQGAGASWKAIYFDNEGHVIHYDVSSPAADTAVFISDASQPGPQFKLVYELKGSSMYGKFQIRMPGQAEFKSYLEWSGEKSK